MSEFRMAILGGLIAMTIIVTHIDVSAAKGDDDLCELLEIAESGLTADERERFQKFSISETSMEVEGEHFYLIGKNIKGSCREKFLSGGILARMVAGKVDGEHLEFLRERESYVVETIMTLWKNGGIRNSDLAHDRELLLTSDYFEIGNRIEMIRTAFETDGLSHAVAYSLWITPIPKYSDLRSRLRRYLQHGESPHIRLIATILLLRIGDGEDMNSKNLLESLDLSSEKRRLIRNLLERLKKGEAVPFADFDLLGLMPDD